MFFRLMAGILGFVSAVLAMISQLFDLISMALADIPNLIKTMAARLGAWLGRGPSDKR